MKLNRVAVRAFMGAVSIEIMPSRPIQLVAGANGAGKSSFLEGVKAGLIGTIDRVALKKHYGALVTEGERIGTVIIEHDGGRRAFTVPNGRHEVEGGIDGTDFLPFVLDPHKFSGLEPAARRPILMDLCDAKADADSVAKRLAKEFDCDKTFVVDVMARYVAGGFESAEKLAREKASEARGAWKAITGKAWSSQASATWEAPAAEPVSDEDVEKAWAELGAAAEKVSQALREQGAIEQKAREYAKAVDEIERLKEHAEKIDRIRDKLKRDEEELKIWTEKLAALPPPAGTPAPTLACPDCGAVLKMQSGMLVHHDHSSAPDPEVEIKRKSQQDAVALYTRSVENGKRDLLLAEQAKVKLAELQEIEPVDAGAITAAKEHAKACDTAHRAAQAAHTSLVAMKQQHDDANRLTAAAQVQHKEVVAWVALAEALSPEGLPARILADALDPINAALVEIGNAFEWGHARINADMAIEWKGRPYNLLSKGEQFRVDVMLTVAIARLSGLRFAIIDGADILDPQGREDLLFGLDEAYVMSDSIDQVFVGMTLRQRPSQTLGSCEAHWIEKGYVVADEEIQQAA